MTSDEQWQRALDVASNCEPESMGSALVLLDWEGQKGLTVQDLVSGDAADSLELFGAPSCLAVMQQCWRAMLPGAHIALWVPGDINDLGGLALRLAGFEIRDAISVVTEDEVFYWHLGRKAMPGNIIESTLAHGTGGINISATRVGSTVVPEAVDVISKPAVGTAAESLDSLESQGRFPPNVILGDVESADAMDSQAPDAGGSGQASGPTHSGESSSNSMSGKFNGMGDRAAAFYGDTGGASRFFPRSATSEEFGAEWVKRLIDTPEAPCLELS